MSERLKSTPENKTEVLDVSAEAERNLERIKSKAETEAQPEAKEIQSLHEQTKEKAISGKEVTIGEKESTHNDTPLHGTYRELKNASYERSLKRIQSKLPSAQRSFSRLIHKPVVEAVSEPLAKTVARPSGILGGGLFALIGNSWLLYLSKSYGFAYNFFTFFVLIAIGFALGIAAELIIRFIKSKK